MEGSFPACLFGVKKASSTLQVLGEKCFWMLGYSEHCCFLLNQSALTMFVHNNLSFLWNDLQVSYAVQRDRKNILYANRLPLFTSILPLQELSFPIINDASCKWLQISIPQARMREVAQHLASNLLFISLQSRDKSTDAVGMNKIPIALRCETLIFISSFVNIFFPEQKSLCTERVPCSNTVCTLWHIPATYLHAWKRSISKGN